MPLTTPGHVPGPDLTGAGSHQQVWKVHTIHGHNSPSFYSKRQIITSTPPHCHESARSCAYSSINQQVVREIPHQRVSTDRHTLLAFRQAPHRAPPKTCRRAAARLGGATGYFPRHQTGGAFGIGGINGEPQIPTGGHIFELDCRVLYSQCSLMMHHSRWFAAPSLEPEP